jgi:methionyl-tRNA formyltransferase
MIQSILIQVEKSYSATIMGMVKQEYPNIHIVLINELSELIALPFSTLKKSRLISFSSPNIVPAKILSLLGHGAYNFHPGPPSRPGWGAIEKAIYDQDRAFGTTLHIMNEYVDSGPIIAINLFPIPPNVKRQDLVNLAFQNLLNLFLQHIKELVESDEDLIELPIEWGHKKFTKADYSAYCTISEDITKEELELRIRAFQASNRPSIRFAKGGKVFALAQESTAGQNLPHTIQLHGYTFEES